MNTQLPKYRSKNKYDVYVWILKIIESCRTAKHIKSAITLRDIFYGLHDDSHLYNLQNGTIGKMETRIATAKLYNRDIDGY